MTSALLVNVTPSETRVAYIDGGILQEIHIEREARRGIGGNIYWGRVRRVVAGMQSVSYAHVEQPTSVLVVGSGVVGHIKNSRRHREGAVMT